MSSAQCNNLLRMTLALERKERAKKRSFKKDKTELLVSVRQFPDELCLTLIGRGRGCHAS